MARVQKTNPELMKPVSREEIYRAKAERRKRLAALPLEEKVRIMEELQKMGRAMIEARKQLPGNRGK